MELVKAIWTQDDYSEFEDYLCSVSDPGYKAFSASLIPGSEGKIIGVRIPMLRKIAREIAKGDAESFLKYARGRSNEELIVEGLVTASKKCGFDELLEDILRFSDKIDNWAVNDIVKFTRISKYRAEMAREIDRLLFDGGPWRARFGLKILMDNYLDDEYIDLALEKTAEVRSDEYYVYMMQGWLLATAAVKYSDKVFALLESGRLTADTVVTAVGKMRDSRRISAEDKERARIIRNDIRREAKGGNGNAEKRETKA